MTTEKEVTHIVSVFMKGGHVLDFGVHHSASVTHSVSPQQVEELCPVSWYIETDDIVATIIQPAVVRRPARKKREKV
jgi:hypothetical protein